MNNKRGITLVALVITIVILLILAGISIIGLTKAGVLKNAELAKEEYQKSVKKEENDLNKINEYIKGNRENNTKESELIQEVTFEVIETKGISIKVQINVKETNENDARGYFVYINDEVVAVKDENIIKIEKLNMATEYKIKCGVIDKNGNIKESSENKVQTLEKEVLYDGVDSSIFEPFRVDSASSYEAYGQKNGYYIINALDSNGRAGININNKIDLTNIKKIIVNTDLSNNYGSSFIGTIYLGICNQKNNSIDFIKSINYSTNATKNERKILELDVSDIEGEYYIKTIVVHPSNVTHYGFTSNIYSIELN
jgi:Tfp pilus assembly protein PilE